VSPHIKEFLKKMAIPLLIEAANQYLRSNPGLAVWKCETVERKVEVGPTIELDKMSIHHSTYGFNVFILGVR
jgi:hypothetical protein